MHLQAEPETEEDRAWARAVAQAIKLLRDQRKARQLFSDRCKGALYEIRHLRLSQDKVLKGSSLEIVLGYSNSGVGDKI